MNNAAERAIRPLTLGRRKWTFLASDSGGERAAVLYTLIQTCRFNGIKLEAYLADLIGRVSDHPANRIDELLPWNWRAPLGRQTGRLTVAAVTRVYALPLAAEILGEDAEMLWEIHVDIEPEDGCLWVCGTDDQQIPAFTDFGLEP